MDGSRKDHPLYLAEYKREEPAAPSPFRIPPAESPRRYEPSGYVWLSREERFYRQAKEWEDRTEEGFADLPFFCYYPTYDNMSAQQLRWYFTWRARLRQGEFIDTSLSYIFVRAFELINLIGVDSPEEGLAKLLTLWKSARGTHPELDRYMPGWVKSFVIFYHCSEDYADLILDVDRRAAGKTLFAEQLVRLFTEKRPQRILGLIDGISSYRLLKSKFVGENRELFEKTLCGVLIGVNDYLTSKKKRTLLDRFTRLRAPVRWYPFSGAVFYLPPQTAYCENRSFRFSGRLAYYTAKPGEWMTDAPSSLYDYDKKTRDYLGQLAKATESTLRMLRGYRGRLRTENIPTDLFLATQKYVTRFYYLNLASPEEKRALLSKSEAVRGMPAPPVDFRVDKARLDALRTDSDDIRDLLLAGEDQLPGPDDLPEETAPVAPPQPDEPDTEDAPGGWEAFVSALNAPQREALSLLLAGEGGRVEEIARQAGSMPEPFFEEINALAVDLLGDSLITPGSPPSLFEEYAGELREALGENK